MGGSLALLFRGNGGSDDCRAIAVSHVVLNDKYGTNSALFTANYRTEVGVINVAPSDTVGQFIHSP